MLNFKTKFFDYFEWFNLIHSSTFVHLFGFRLRSNLKKSLYAKKSQMNGLALLKNVTEF